MSPRGHAEKWAARMKQACKLASEISHYSSARRKQYYVQHVKGVTLKTGDHVLVRNLDERGDPGKKLRSYCEETVYIVKEQMSSGPVVCPERGDGRTCTLHRNLLHLVNDLPADLPSPPLPEKKRNIPQHLPASSETISPEKEKNLPVPPTAIITTS